MTEEERKLRMKLEKIERLYNGATTDGEKEASEMALKRIKEAILSLRKERVDDTEKKNFAIKLSYNDRDNELVRIISALSYKYRVNAQIKYSKTSQTIFFFQTTLLEKEAIIFLATKIREEYNSQSKEIQQKIKSLYDSIYNLELEKKSLFDTIIAQGANVYKFQVRKKADEIFSDDNDNLPEIDIL
jgi:hypothetical protein